ncbi:GTPase Obg/CgtA,GTPase Obg,GTP-binding protein 10,Probable GTP-binding protein OBGM, mitochondrial,GTP-binding protein 10 homolog [Lepeophtheirus salmonis]|uniref:GTPase Obg/CgtA,GTPase Obg,GTP-binding protein 10,Probable GTP-binding protein OBGM, mitochondrial,GTP-binding protein 10 homolog n=1 Tax=Lepeophtheirus salmonis TaxID=72036 RepID=A0A7R8CYW4_LEPSM|nr:GTPase Obg/CgtA,GTPase Obg,GTP-binding protein 10,Probable GTP-binding protein OBGM, mitochondrial,GTP-binding protein 10 homolog [Lepeophtheirus salmonis]CAF2944681.1 GTPase Obg/CgtA,GTPase Obg,GTP-binding protein 10,Probable GTP-binding protein OBGM, mitochondrial,GTP-binding protein 10 homolog [Lepeophtheirus salmonis]
MVHVSRVLLLQKSKKVWIDSLRVYVKGGHGGNGLPSIGGVGGSGGSVLITPSKKVKSLSNVYYDHFPNGKQRLIASPGETATKSLVRGQCGKDINVEVPVGIQVFDDHQRLLKDLDDENLQVRVALGGNGGGPSNGWMGQSGQVRHIRLDLKIIADVGLVGFPNAGKSTLLKAISRANPKIASYPFTTIKPNLGEVLYSKDQRKISLADLPGLIEGASYNVGMGHRFLKHVERTRLLLFVIDVNGFELQKGALYRSPFETLVLLNKEIELYNPDLLKKPCICVVNKRDSEGSEDKFEELQSLIENFGNNALNSFDSDDKFCPTKFLEISDILPISAKYSKKINIVWTVEFLLDIERSTRGGRNLGIMKSILTKNSAREVIFGVLW